MKVLIKSPETNSGERISAIHALDERISEWWSKLPTSFHLTPSSVADVPLDVLPNLLLIHIVHHQCLCALHASIVPLFCWSSASETWLPARQLSAQIAFDNARVASQLIDAVLSNYPRLGAMPSFIAYAAYCGCAIQIPFMWCTDPTVRQSAYANVKANVRMIHALAKYWKFAALLVRYYRLSCPSLRFCGPPEECVKPVPPS